MQSYTHRTSKATKKQINKESKNAQKYTRQVQHIPGPWLCSGISESTGCKWILKTCRCTACCVPLHAKELENAPGVCCVCYECVCVCVCECVLSCSLAKCCSVCVQHLKQAKDAFNHSCMQHTTNAFVVGVRGWEAPTALSASLSPVGYAQTSSVTRQLSCV